MTNRKNTKRALLASALSLMLCFAMLVGTTFAWFTDSDVLKDNVIKAGTLDIKLDDTTTLFSIDSLWEPGYSEPFETEVENIGTLWLKYQLNITGLVVTDGAYSPADDDAVADNPDGSDISTVLDVYVGTAAADMNEDNYLGTVAELFANQTAMLEGILAPANADEEAADGEEYDTTDTLNLIIKMREEAGNEYQNDSIKFDISVLATQYTAEIDGFDNKKYDENALYPAVAPVVAKGDTTVEAVKIDVDDYAGQTDAIVAADGTVTINSGNFNGGTTAFGTAGNTAVWANGGDVVINDGYFTIAGLAEGDTGHIDLIYAGNGNITINGGTYEAVDETVWLLNAKDGSGNVITVNAGTFINWDPRTNTGDGEIVINGTVTETTRPDGIVVYTVTAA